MLTNPTLSNCTVHFEIQSECGLQQGKVAYMSPLFTLNHGELELGVFIRTYRLAVLKYCLVLC